MLGALESGGYQIRSSYLAELERLFLCAGNGEGCPHSRGALTPSNVPRTFSVRLNRFTGTPQCSTIGDAVSLCLCLSLLPSPSPLSLPRPRAAGAHTAARPAPLMHCERGTAPLAHGT